MGHNFSTRIHLFECEKEEEEEEEEKNGRQLLRVRWNGVVAT